MINKLRYIIIPAATAAAIAGIAAFFNVPNPVADAVTGATVRVEGERVPELEGEYMFVINKLSDAFKDGAESVMNAVKTNGGGTGVARIPSFSLAVSESDPALIGYAEELCKALRASGADVRLKEYSKTMLRSRVLAGKYDAFIASRGFTDAEAIKNSEFIMLQAEGMKQK